MFTTLVKRFKKFTNQRKMLADVAQGMPDVQGTRIVRRRWEVLSQRRKLSVTFQEEHSSSVCPKL